MDIFGQIAGMGTDLRPVDSYMRGQQFRQQNELAKMQMEQKKLEMQNALANPGRGKFGMNPIYGKDAQGNTVVLQLNEAGGIQPVQLPEGVNVSRNLTWRDFGDTQVGYDPTGAPVAERRNMPGPTQTPTYIARTEKAKAEGRSQGEAVATAEKKAVTAENTLDLIKEARTILPEATGSRGGKMLDVGAGLVGYSTQGAQASARLKVIGGNLKMSQPRMEGPQSNLDQLLYAEMAGQVGDDTLPIETRLAALDEVERIQLRYANQNEPQKKTAKDLPGYREKPRPEAQKQRLRYNPATGEFE